MSSTASSSSKPVGVIGSGSFGKCVANLLAANNKVLLHVRSDDVYEAIQIQRHHNGQDIHPNIQAVRDAHEVAQQCTLLFPVVPSKVFRQVIRDLSPSLRPSHILIHGTKGLDVVLTEEEQKNPHEMILSRHRVKTMSEVIQEESAVLRVGSLSGPNLAREIAAGLPAGSVISSHFREVIHTGRKALESSRFMVFENYDLMGVEISGVLKNILALGSGMISGLELGENARALLITRGWRELMRLARLFDSDQRAFMGLAGIGDMIATCSSPLSRNYTVGFRLAKGEKLPQIIDSMEEVAEGVRTITTAMGLVRYHNLRSPIVEAFHKVLFHDLPLRDAVQLLITEKHALDVDFI